MAKTLRLGTRGSALAMAQSQQFAEALSARTGVIVETVLIRTLGDAHQTSASAPPPGVHAGVGIFTKALEDALAEGRIDFAVHSLKDLPCVLDDRFVLAAVPEREDHRDALCAAAGVTFDTLPSGARIGTGSPRRRALLAHRARVLGRQIDLIPIRGNVDTRLGKIGREVDAVILAVSGLRRAGLADRITEPLDLLPAPGQGALGIECRADDVETRQLLSALDDAATRAAVTAERTLHLALGGGCYAPIAALANVTPDRALTLKAQVASLDGSQFLEARHSGHVEAAELVAQKVADALIAQGATPLLHAARAEVSGS